MRPAPGRVWPADYLHLIFFGGHLLLQTFTFGRMPGWGFWTAADLLMIGGVFLVMRLSGRGRPRRDALLRLAHGCLAIPLVFTQVGLTIRALELPDHAASLAALDRWFFGGVDPLESLEAVASPWLTEIMQWGYSAYVLLPPAAVVLLALRARPQVITRSVFSLLAVFYLSYVGYYLVPASGPNIHNNFGPILPVDVEVLRLYTFRTDLPGVWATETLRRWMFEVELTKMDCFPSGHAAAAVVVTVHAFRVGRRYGLLLLPLCLGVVLSTVYLRYHYVVDVLAGLVLAWVCVGPLERLHRRLEVVLSSSFAAGRGNARSTRPDPEPGGRPCEPTLS